MDFVEVLLERAGLPVLWYNAVNPGPERVQFMLNTLKYHYPGNYSLEEYDISRENHGVFRYRLKFESEEEELLFILRHG